MRRLLEEYDNARREKREALAVVERMHSSRDARLKEALTVLEFKCLSEEWYVDQIFKRYGIRR